MANKILTQLRWIGLLEGSSFLVLLFIAMPLKYGADWPHAVKVVGMFHGALFVAFAAWAIAACIIRRWPISRLLLAGVASILPFGTFVFDRSLQREQNATPPLPPEHS